MRKKAVRRAHRNGKILHETLQEVTEDTEIKELYFTSPVTFSARRPDGSVGATGANKKNGNLFGYAETFQVQPC